MIQNINLPNYQTNNLLESTRLTADVTAGLGSSLTVENTQGYTPGDFIIIGTPGSELTEKVTINTVGSATDIELSGSTTIDHKAYDRVTKLFGDTLNVYKAPNTNGLQPTDDLFALIGPVLIDIDQMATEFSDPDGGDAWWYKFTYFNSVSNTETSLADSKSARGGGSGDYCSIDAIRQEAGFKYAKYVEDATIDRWRQAAQDEINGTLQGFYDIPFKQPINAFISQICVRLAAGFVLLDQYSETVTLNTSAGQQKVDGARADLNRLALKQVQLTDENGASTAQPGSTGGVASWPNQGTASTPGYQGGSKRIFRMSDIAGYHGRKF